MEYRRLGNSGLQVSVLGLGTNSFGGRANEEASQRIIDAAIDGGVNFIDTANIYTGGQSETIIGKALKGKRHNVLLATKGGSRKGDGPNQSGSGRVHLMAELETSLNRLQTDYVDLYQIHTFDPHTPLEETLQTLDDMVRSGKVRYVGASNYFAWELMKSLSISEHRGLERFVSIQNSYSLADRTPEVELTPMCEKEGIGVIPYFPLAGGILTGKYQQGGPAPTGSRADTEPRFQSRIDGERVQLAHQVSQLSQQLGHTATAVSIAWLMHQPSVSTVIVGASRPEQVQDNLKSTEITFDDGTLGALDEMSESFKWAPPFATFRLTD
jgi:aryl-alcohol dehydrogenase-like predicted oxidoreductase